MSEKEFIKKQLEEIKNIENSLYPPEKFDWPDNILDLRGECCWKNLRIISENDEIIIPREKLFAKIKEIFSDDSIS